MKIGWPDPAVMELQRLTRVADDQNCLTAWTIRDLVRLLKQELDRAAENLDHASEGALERSVEKASHSLGFAIDDLEQAIRLIEEANNDDGDNTNTKGDTNTNTNG